MNILVAYDVSTETSDGQRRLRKVAIVCKNYGQRVQYSVFECQVNEAQYEALRAQLLKSINPKVDSIRLYKLSTSREHCVESYGVDKYVDFNEPLIL
jgi:CRISPR-associated protein Cas2